MQSHWSQAAIDRFETEQRALYFEAIDTVMGALALAVWEVGADESAVHALLRRLGLPCWPVGSSAEEARVFRGHHWGAWECVYFREWQQWAPLTPAERQSAHVVSWRRRPAAEAMEVRVHGACWWRSMTMPNPEHVAAFVDVTAGLRLARGARSRRDLPAALAGALVVAAQGRHQGPRQRQAPHRCAVSSGCRTKIPVNRRLTSSGRAPFSATNRKISAAVASAACRRDRPVQRVAAAHRIA